MKKYFNVIDNRSIHTVNEVTNYIKNNFNINNTTYLLIDSIINYLQKNNSSYETYYYINDEVYIPCYIVDLISILNDSNIDVSIDELLKNNILVEDNHE